ncbi:hypothetical protein JHK82_042907 [Glycine max]|nr:hypothetical protein JHK82_042907 [Glycine max]
MNVGKHIKYEVATSKVINLDFDSFLEENPLVKKQKMYKNKRNERMHEPPLFLYTEFLQSTKPALDIYSAVAQHESARPDDTRHGGAVRWLSGSVGSRESHPQTRRAQEKLGSLLLVSTTSSREAWKPQVPRATTMTHEVFAPFETSISGSYPEVYSLV